jgi:hypothetical protein
VNEINHAEYPKKLKRLDDHEGRTRSDDRESGRSESWLLRGRN